MENLIDVSTVDIGYNNHDHNELSFYIYLDSFGPKWLLNYRKLDGYKQQKLMVRWSSL